MKLIIRKSISKEILEKLYPIGAYYWSQNNESPEKLFGGKWERIYGRFLFASDGNYSVGLIGGEENHVLTIEEIPSHRHNFNCFHVNDWTGIKYVEYEFTIPANSGSVHNFHYTFSTESIGSNKAHNNMPPYIVANCWKRIK